MRVLIFSVALFAIFVAMVAKVESSGDKMPNFPVNISIIDYEVDTTSATESTTTFQTTTSQTTTDSIPETTPDPNLKQFRELAFFKLGTYRKLYKLMVIKLFCNFSPTQDIAIR